MCSTVMVSTSTTSWKRSHNERSSFATSRSQRHQKERRDRLNRKNGEAHILACHHLSYGHHKIIAAIPTKMATKRPGIIATSMIPS